MSGQLLFHTNFCQALMQSTACPDLPWAIAAGEKGGPVCRFWEHHWVWWTAPFLGAALAAKLYAKYVMPKDQLKELRAEVEQA